MGGNKDKSGSVDAKKLIQVLKNEFKMTIDIEVISICICNISFFQKLINEIDTDGSGLIEFDEFAILLS